MKTAYHRRCSWRPRHDFSPPGSPRWFNGFCDTLQVSIAALLLWPSMISHLIADDQQAVGQICSAMQAATVRIVSGTDVSSGVIVTSDGHILTVAHGLHKETGSVTIIFSDGQMSEAQVLLRDTGNDVAVLRIAETREARSLLPIPIRLSSVPEKGHMVLAAGYPGRESNGLSAVVRLGELLAVEPKVLRSSCTLTTGDSGGPLLNHKGELIGLHRQIGLGNESNLHHRIDRVGEVIAAVLDLKVIAPDVHKLPAAGSRLPPGAEVRTVCRLRTVEIRRNRKDESPVVLGTLLDSFHVATKLSELNPSAEIFCRCSSGTTCTATVASSDVALDLAILRLAEAQAAVTPLKSAAGGKDADVSHVACRIVFAALGSTSVSNAGIVTRETHTEPSMTGKLGAVLEVADPVMAVRVKDVAPNSTAAKAGFAAKDVIIAINRHAVQTLDDIASTLIQRQPGDWLEFEFRHEEKSGSAFAQFQHDPGERFERTEFLDGRSGRVSERRSGFENVIQHDVPLTPAECGGPLCDWSGRIIAINIARRARESSLAVPIRRVLQMLDQDAR